MCGVFRNASACVVGRNRSGRSSIPTWPERVSPHGDHLSSGVMMSTCPTSSLGTSLLHRLTPSGSREPMSWLPQRRSTVFVVPHPAPRGPPPTSSHRRRPDSAVSGAPKSDSPRHARRRHSPPPLDIAAWRRDQKPLLRRAARRASASTPQRRRRPNHRRRRTPSISHGQLATTVQHRGAPASNPLPATPANHRHITCNHYTPRTPKRAKTVKRSIRRATSTGKPLKWQRPKGSRFFLFLGRRRRRREYYRACLL